MSPGNVEVALACDSRKSREKVNGFDYSSVDDGELVSVANYADQSGDPMRDPEIVFEVAAGEWHPVSIQQDFVGSYREAVSVAEDGTVFVRPAEVRDIQAFARIWDRNLKHQGFVDAANNRDAGPSPDGPLPAVED